jgi:hypothetical protein
VKKIFSLLVIATFLAVVASTVGCDTDKTTSKAGTTASGSGATTTAK